MIVLLDSGPLGILTNPKGPPVTLECHHWVESLLLKGYRMILPDNNRLGSAARVIAGK